MPYNYNDDQRIDPRIRAVLSLIPDTQTPPYANREELLALCNSPEAVTGREQRRQMMELLDSEDIAPSAGLRIERHDVPSTSGGPTINVTLYRPDTDAVLPAIYYIHGGGMTDLSAHDANYRAWCKTLAAQGAAVVAVDFRNALTPSSVPEVAPYPAGLQDCHAGLLFTVAHTGDFGIDPSRIIVAGESGGGNLTLALGMLLLREGAIDLVKGLYALCPYIAGSWPREDLPSSITNNGIFLDLHSAYGRLGYGIEAFDAGDPLAWPLFATAADVAGLPPVVIHVNELDPLRDEGIAFYRTLLNAGVAATCLEWKGTTHGMEIMTAIVPNISRNAARQIVAFATD